jgi:hypothetical protein
LVWASTAQAVLLGYEGFAGYTPNAPIGGQSGTGTVGFAPGSTWTGTLHNALPTSLSYTNGGTLLTSGGSIISNQSDPCCTTNIRPLENPIATTTTTGEEFWVAYLFRSGPVLQDANLVRFYVETTGEDGERIDLNVIRGWPDTSKQLVRMGAWYTDPNGTEGGDTLFRPVGEDNLIVMQFQLDDSNNPGNQGVMRAWVNPVIGGAPPSAASAASVFTNIGGFNEPDMMRLWTPGKGSDAVYRDEIRWGTSFASVTPLAAAAAPGDYNLDGSVNQLDYLQWVAEYGTGPANSDGNGDGVVDAADYTVWRDNVPAPATGTSVPEPSAMVAIVACFGGLCGFRRR